MASGTSSPAVNGGTTLTLSPGSVPDGTYYWTLRATDIAGNQTAWTTPTRSFVLDTHPPGTPALTARPTGRISV